MFGIGGIVTFKNAKQLQEAVGYLDVGKIVLETDAPWLAPMPYRGKTNYPFYTKYILEKIAELKEIEPETLSEIIFANTCKIFKLSLE